MNNATKNRDDASSWRIPTAIQFVWAAVLAGGMCLLPESPRWLVKRGKDEAASGAMARLLGYEKGAPEVELELDDIRVALEEERAAGKFKYLGMSEASAATIRRAAKVARVDAFQVEFSPWS